MSTIGAGVSEIAAEYLRKPKFFESVDDALSYKNKIVEVSNGIVSAYARELRRLRLLISIVIPKQVIFLLGVTNQIIWLRLIFQGF